VCKDDTTRNYQNEQCQYSYEEFCSAGCLNGDCLPAGCVDSDRGVKYDEQGHLTDPKHDNADYWDTCSGKTLTEYYCDANGYNFISHDCAGECLNGACQPLAVPLCDAGWKCKDSSTKHYQDTECELSQEEECKYGCSDGVCLSHVCGNGVCEKGRVYANAFVAPTSVIITGGVIPVVLDSEIDLATTNKDLIIIGSPENNKIAAQLLKVPYPASKENFTNITGVGYNTAIIKQFEGAVNGLPTGKVALLVAGYEPKDTFTAIKTLIAEQRYGLLDTSDPSAVVYKDYYGGTYGSYPFNFQNSVIVVGADAAYTYSFPASYIATDIEKVMGEYYSQGNGWSAQKGDSKLFLNSDFEDIDSKINATDIPLILSDGIYSDTKGTNSQNIGYKQFLNFEDKGNKFELNGMGGYDIINDGGASVYTYALNFTTDVLYNSAATKQDFKGTKLNILGKEWTFTDATNASGGIINKIVLMSGDRALTIKAGEYHTYIYNGKIYTIISAVLPSGDASFNINGADLPVLNGGIGIASDGLIVGVTETLDSDKDSILDTIVFYLGAKQLVLANGQEVSLNGDNFYKSKVIINSAKNVLSSLSISYSNDTLIDKEKAWTEPIFYSFKIAFTGVSYDGETLENCPQDCEIPVAECDGCSLEGQCLPFGKRVGAKYCSMDKYMAIQKLEEDYCDENYECTTNECTEGRCVSSYNLIKQIWCNVYAATSITASIPEIVAGVSISEQYWNSVYRCLGKPIGPDLAMNRAEIFNDLLKERADLEIQLRNIGTKSAENFVVYYSVYYDTKNETIKNGEEIISALGPARPAYIPISLRETGILTPGTYSIWVEIDSHYDINEISEYNNIYSNQITIALYSDWLIENNIGDYSYQSSTSQTEGGDNPYTLYMAGYKLYSLPDNSYVARVFEFENRTYVDNFINIISSEEVNYVSPTKRNYKGNNVVYDTASGADIRGIVWTNGNMVIIVGSLLTGEGIEPEETPQADLEVLYDAYLNTKYSSDLVL
jgi:hypothetical protein